MRASRRALLSAGMVTALVASLLASFSITAGAQSADPTVARVDVRNILAGTANGEFQITVKHRAGLPINAVMITTPEGPSAANEYTLLEGRAQGWQPLILDSRTVFFTGGTLNPGGGVRPEAGQATFSVFANVPRGATDWVSRWVVATSSNGGDNLNTTPPEDSGALSTIIRVLRVTSVGITAPEGAVDGTVTGNQANVDAVCRVENVGSGLLDVTAQLESDDGNFTASSGGTADIGPGGSHSFPFDLKFADVSGNDSDTAICSARSPNKADTGPFGDEFDVSIQPRALFEYEDDSLSPQLVAPGANPTFSIRVEKGPGASPAVTLDQGATNFRFATFGPTGLASATTIPAGSEDSAFLQFAAALVPDLEDAEYGVTINVVGTDENGAPVRFAPLPNVDDLVRVDASIPQVVPRIDPPAARCCAAEPAVKNGDVLDISGAVTDRDPESGDQAPCDGCTVVKAELIQFSDRLGSNEVGRIDVTNRVTVEDGELSGDYDGSYHPAAKSGSVQLAVIVRDIAGNRSGGGSTGTPTFSNLSDVDNVVPAITAAVATPAPTAADRDLQRQLTVEFSEPVDNFSQPVDGMCPGPDWRADDNTVVSCSRSADFLKANLLVAEQLPDDGPDLGTLGYFPNAVDVVSFHDRVDLPIPLGSRVDILDRIPPKAPSIDTVDGQGPDSDDDRFYTDTSSPAVVLSGDRAVKAGYTVQVWVESNGIGGLQPGTNNPSGASDDKIGQAVAQGPQVTVPTTGALLSDGTQDGKEHTVYGRSLDTASPANATPMNLIEAFSIVVDTSAPSLTAAAQIDRILVTFGGTGGKEGTGGVHANFQGEVVRGHNSAAHWRIFNDSRQGMNATGVEGENQPTRDVMMSCPPGSTPITCQSDGRYSRDTVASIEYRYFGTPANRYHDRAGNFVVSPGAVSI